VQGTEEKGRNLIQKLSGMGKCIRRPAEKGSPVSLHKTDFHWRRTRRWAWQGRAAPAKQKHRWV